MSTLMLTAWIACQSLDLGTTLYGLRQPGIREGNPVMRGPHLSSVKVSVNLGLLIWRQQSRGPVRWVIPASMAATGCTAGALNIGTIRRAR